MKLIPLTKGQFAMVEDSDYKHLSRFSWHVYSPRRSPHLKYARRGINHRGKVTMFSMHRDIIGKRGCLDVDHVDGNGLNNQRANLRFATRSQNAMNRSIVTRNRTGLKGVSYRPELKVRKWQVRITIGRKTISVGYFGNTRDAAKAYDIAAKRLFGKYAKTNKAMGLL